ncbi:MAG: TIGR03986 family CRISPR-associated RAMP protein [Caldilineaceae bacterium]|nr:TIGR03986 family CRISPR-associated RAMP protein [Caldilineaceae bacterium]
MASTSQLPKQVNPSTPRESAVAPYNFVPLNDELLEIDPLRELPDQDRYHAGGRLSGMLECTLTTMTPLFIRAPLEPERFEQLDADADRKESYDKRLKNRSAFHYTDPDRTPSIPGSSLRGMIRTLVEVIGHGKFEYGSQTPLVYRSIGDMTDHGERYRQQILQKDQQGRDERGKLFHAYTPRVRAGYLVQEQGNWLIYPAQQIHGTTFARINHKRLLEVEETAPDRNGLEPIPGCKNAAYIYIQPGPWVHQRVRGGLIRMRYAKVLRSSAEPGSGLVKGALARSGPIFSKRSEAVVFPLDPNARPLSVEEEMLATYRDQISQEQQHLLGDDGVLTGPGSDDASLSGDNKPVIRQPVFYLIDKQGNLVFFGHTMMMRLPYPHSPRDYVPERLREDATIDLAEAIFGYTKQGDGGSPPKGQEKRRAYAGRVFFGDARLEPNQDDIWLSKDAITPRILATPKPTAFQQYLVQTYPDPVKVGETRDGRNKMQKFLADYTVQPPGERTNGETTLRGYKFYWHKAGSVTESDFAEPKERLNERRTDNGRSKRDSQYTQMRPLKEGVCFRFQIRFENLSELELGALLWSIRLPVAAEGQRYLHKLGMGKPLGLGSVALDASLCLDDRPGRYSRLFDSEAGAAWYLGNPSHQENLQIDQLMDAFEQEMNERLGNQTKEFCKLPRIETLLKLLTWPGRSMDESRYLEIERRDGHGKRNEYRDRPVLPTPLSTQSMPKGKPHFSQPKLADIATPEGDDSPVTGARVQTIISTEETKPHTVDQALVGDIMATLGGKKSEPTLHSPPGQDLKLDKPADATDIMPGMTLEGTVIRVEQNRVVVQLDVPDVGESSLMIDQIFPKPADAAALAERFPIDQKIVVQVRRINKRGRVQLMIKES